MLLKRYHKKQFEETEETLNDDILRITMHIAKIFPELSKYIGEMPVKISFCNSKEMNIKTLKDYYDSLYTFLEEYKMHHSYPK